jgi:hypothetical protein
MKTKKKNSDSEHAFILMFRELKLERFQRQYLLYLLVELMELDRPCSNEACADKRYKQRMFEHV